MNRRDFIGSAIVVSMAAIPLAGCVGQEPVQADIPKQKPTAQPSQSPSVQSTVTETSTPEVEKSVKVLSQEFYTGDFGSFGVKGEIENVIDKTLSYVEVSVKFFDEAGTRIAEGLDNIGNLAPGQTASFNATALTTDVDPGSVTDWELSTDITVIPGSSSNNYVKVLSKEMYIKDYGSFGVKGKLKNISSETVENVFVSAKFFDRNGTRIAEGTDNITDLSSGTTATYDAMTLSTTDPEKVQDFRLSVTATNY